jgi:hypothetical protein
VRRTDRIGNGGWLRSVDWLGWLALAWAVWFGIQYASMIVETRGGRLKELIRPRHGPAPEATSERRLGLSITN